MNEKSYEEAWADEGETAASAATPAPVEPAVAESAAASNTADEPKTAATAPLVAIVATPMAPGKSMAEAKAEHDTQVSSEAEEFRKAFAETPDMEAC